MFTTLKFKEDSGGPKLPGFGICVNFITFGI